VRLFGDNPSPTHPFSIHDIARVGRTYGKAIGEWFAPSTISLSLLYAIYFLFPSSLPFIPFALSPLHRELMNVHKPTGMKFLVSEDGALYLDKIAAAFSLHYKGKGKGKAPETTEKGKEEGEGGEGEEWCGAVIMVPLRLGLESMNSVYYQPVIELFQFPQSLGVVGGKPRASLYFIAAQG
jgi:cysteine protease ATG4